VSRVPDQHALPTRSAERSDFDMDLSNQWASGIEHFQPPVFGFVLNGSGNTMSAEDHNRVIRHLNEFVDKHRTPFAQILYDMSVVNHLMPDIDGPTKNLECAINDINSAVYPRTETSRVGQYNIH
jgi:hypothetical protein